MIESLLRRANEISGNTVEAQKWTLISLFDSGKVRKEEEKKELVTQIRGMSEVERGKQLYARIYRLKEISNSLM